MGSFTQSVLNALLSWLRTGITGLWDIVNSKDTQTSLQWLGENWLVPVLLLAAGGVIIDFFIWLIRWRPFYVWGSSWRRFKRHFLKAERAEAPLPRRAYHRTPAFEPQYDEAPVFQTQAYAPVEEEAYYEEPYAEEEYIEEREPIYTPPPAPYVLEEVASPYERPRQQVAPTPRREGRRSATTHRRTGLFGSVARNIKQNFQEAADDGEFAPFAPPKPRIDRTTAFHTPAYPPGWQEDTHEEDPDFQEE